jgi:hypothetical protein
MIFLNMNVQMLNQFYISNVELLKELFELLKETQRSDFELIWNCVYTVLELGHDHSRMTYDLVENVDVFVRVKALLGIHSEDSRRKEKILELAYYSCQHMIADYRFEMCRFTEDICEGIGQFFGKRVTNSRQKSHLLLPPLLSLLDLSLMVHVPLIGGSSNLDYIADPDKWKKMMKTYEQALKVMLIQTYNTTSKKKVAEVELSLPAAFAAARFCFYYYWNDDLRDMNENTNNTDGENAAKRSKHISKMEAVLDNVNPTSSMEKFNWNWLLVFAELIYNFPSALENDHIHSILTMLAKCQVHVESNKQQYAFTMCCYVLLQHDQAFKAKGNTIVYNHCEELWSKICKEATRVCTSASNNSIQTHGLLQILVYHNKCPENLIVNIVDLFKSNLVIKCDYTLNTLIAVLQSFNLDSMKSGNKLASSILGYIFEKPNVDVLRKVRTMTSDKPTHQVVSKLAVMCCILKTELIKYMRHTKIDDSALFGKILDLSQLQAYKTQIAKNIELIQMKCYDLLLIELEPKIPITFDEKMLQIPTELKCIIDVSLYAEMMKLTAFQSKAIGVENSVIEIKNYLIDVLESNNLMLNLATTFLKFESFDNEKYKSSFITKKIDFNLQDIDRLFALLNQSGGWIDADNKFLIVTLLKALFHNNYHAVLCKKIRSQNLDNCLKWILDQATHQHVDYSEENRERMAFGEKAFQNAQRDEKLRYLAVTTLCEYLNYENESALRLEEEMPDLIGFAAEDNMDLHIIFDVLKILGKRGNVSLKLASWLWTGIGSICEHHRDDNYFMGCIIDELSNIVVVSKNHVSLVTNIVKLFSTLTLYCSEGCESNRVLSTRLVVKVLEHLKSFHQVMQCQMKCNSIF